MQKKRILTFIASTILKWLKHYINFIKIVDFRDGFNSESVLTQRPSQLINVNNNSNGINGTNHSDRYKTNSSISVCDNGTSPLSLNLNLQSSSRSSSSSSLSSSSSSLAPQMAYRL
jgi:hypothetical protein